MVPNKHPVPVHNSNDITTSYDVARHANFLKTHECKNCKIYKMLAAVPGVGSCLPSQYRELNPACTKKSSPSSCILGHRRASATRGGKNQLLGTVFGRPSHLHKQMQVLQLFAKDALSGGEVTHAHLT